MTARVSHRTAARTALTIVLLVAVTVVPSGQSPVKGEWRAYAADLASTRYSPLDQINAGNFDTLEVAWRFKTDTTVSHQASCLRAAKRLDR